MKWEATSDTIEATKNRDYSDAPFAPTTLFSVEGQLAVKGWMDEKTCVTAPVQVDDGAVTIGNPEEGRIPRDATIYTREL